MAALQRLAQLDDGAAAAAIAAGPSCFDTAQSGASLWVAAKAAAQSIQMVHTPVSSPQGGNRIRRAAGSTSGSLHGVVHLPEPVAAVQLGIPTAEAAAAAGVAAGTAVLLAVGHSCRVWAFQLQPPAASIPTVPAELHAEGSAAASVPVAQQQCSDRHQLAAAVAWEHLAYTWEPATAGEALQPATVSRGARSRGGPSSSTAAVVPLSLASLQASLQQQFGGGAARQAATDEQTPPLVHTVASWVCLPAAGPSSSGRGSHIAAAAGIPADATAVAYCGSAAGVAGPCPRLVCSARFEFAAGAASGSTAQHGDAIGHLLVATAAGQLLALPVGTLRGERSGQPQLPSAAKQEVVVCYSSSGIWFLHTAGSSSAAAGSKQRQQQRLLLAESGQLVPATGLGGSGPVAIATGSSSVGGCSGGSTSSATLHFPAVRLVGARAAAAMGSSLLYLASDSSGTSSELRCWDSGSDQQAASAVPAVGMPADSLAMLASATLWPGSTPLAQQQLVALTQHGELLAVMPCSHTAQAQQRPGPSYGASVGELERSMQVSNGPLW